MKLEQEKIKKSKDQLVETHQGLVVYIARRYTNCGLDLKDLIQEGNIGLMKAIDRFDYQRGYKFSTYATWWVKQYIMMAISNQSRQIRIPKHAIKAISKIIQTSILLMEEMGREPTAEEIAEKIKFPVEKINELLKVAKKPLSLEDHVGKEERELIDFIEDEGMGVPSDMVINSDRSEELQKLLFTLTPREREVLQMRFGIGEDRTYSLEETASKLSMSKERIRQIESKALRKLKHHIRSYKLRDFIETS